MATALFIKRSDLVKNTIMSGSVDTDKFIQYIKIAQQIHIRNYLGTDLYNKISVTNGGVFKGNSENAQTASKSEVDYLVNKEREFAEYYTRRFIDYMNYNSNLFPEYNTNSNDDIYPDHEATFNGWVL